MSYAGLSLKSRSGGFSVRSCRLVAGVALLAALLAAPLPVQAADAPADLILILDASGSMWGQIEGENKIVIARRVLGDLVDGLPEGKRVSLIAYGHRRDGDCADIETITPLGPLDRGALKSRVNALNPKGKTPITASVQQAFAQLEGSDAGATVILVSDGLETCGGDPCAAVRAAKESGIRFVLHVVGFDVAKEDVSSLECAAQAGDGLFLSAENAGQLSAALETAVELPAEVPPGRLVVKAVADGKLQDVAIHVTRQGKDVAGARTYTRPETNPRSIPLPDGTFDVKVAAVGLKGDIERRFQIEVKDGSAVEKEIDYSTGELRVGATRNGELSDVAVQVYVAGTRELAASGRTYRSASSNPKTIRITAGTYDVELGALEIEGKPVANLGPVTVEPKGQAEVGHEFPSGTLKIGVHRGATLVDATVNIKGPGGVSGGARTYKDAKTNPTTFIVTPGEYRVEVREIRGETRQLTLTVGAGETVERSLDLDVK